mmetsp:Transcript_20052/g.40848  ORF Transcript_20052/g.40848 Transcript_20052/m.40848 type:complete len:134 (+) Transcript_20052:150-551(+)
MGSSQRSLSGVWLALWTVFIPVIIAADVDECGDSPCHEDAWCQNTYGSFSCQCKRGLFGDGVECSASSHSLETVFLVRNITKEAFETDKLDAFVWLFFHARVRQQSAATDVHISCGCRGFARRLDCKRELIVC